MDKSSICRAIAEREEPKPTNTRLNTWGHHNSEEMRRFRSYGYQEKVKGSWERLLSPKGYWQYSIAVDDWFPVDFFTSESANALLLDSMSHAHLEKYEDWVCNANDSIDDLDWGRHPDRKTAVVLAKCKELGIEVGEIEEWATPKTS